MAKVKAFLESWTFFLLLIFLQQFQNVQSDLSSAGTSLENSTENFVYGNNFHEATPDELGRGGAGDSRILEFSAEVEQIIRNEIQDSKDNAMVTLSKIFGLSAIPGNLDVMGSPPEFMIDLYNTITDSYGVTRARNPYNAHIVRSYMEKNNSVHDYFYFNISNRSLSGTETILEAEFHVFRAPTSHDSLHPSLYLTPFYILSLYEVLDMAHLRIPDLHKLLGVNYVPALGSGWEIFNVKQSVTGWVQGVRPNLGFLLVATSLGGDRVPVRFSRRGETVDSKQPNLVLFTEDSTLEPIPPYREKRVKFGKEVKGTTPGGPDGDALRNDTTTNTVEESERDDEEGHPISTSSLENPRFHHALLYKDSIRHPNSVSRFRSRRSKNQTETGTGVNRTSTSTSCGKRDLLVNFEAIGWSSWIISPKGYNAFYCDGTCRFPLGVQVKPTNHATVQSIVHELKLSDGVQTPCCVPTNLLPISLLYYDDHDNVVLRQYVDMVAESCGCH